VNWIYLNCVFTVITTGDRTVLGPVKTVLEIRKYMVSANFYAHASVNAIGGNGNCSCKYCWKH
jgi:hypothetical protein